MTERRGRYPVVPHPARHRRTGGGGRQKESDGPLAAGFDELTTDNRLGQCSWEAAEKQLQLRAARLCLQKAALPAERVDLVLAGDLQAQCTASGYAHAGAGRALCGAVRRVQHHGGGTGAGRGAVQRRGGARTCWP